MRLAKRARWSNGPQPACADHSDASANRLSLFKSMSRHDDCCPAAQSLLPSSSRACDRVPQYAAVRDIDATRWLVQEHDATPSREQRKGNLQSLTCAARAPAREFVRMLEQIEFLQSTICCRSRGLSRSARLHKERPVKGEMLLWAQMSPQAILLRRKPDDTFRVSCWRGVPDDPDYSGGRTTGTRQTTDE